MFHRNYLTRPTIVLMALLLTGTTACSSPASKPVEYQPQSESAQQRPHPAVAVARKMLGKPYRYGGSSPESGFDCSGLVHYAFRHVGISTPRSTKTLYRSSFAVASDALRQGDLLFFRIEGKISHVGIYVGGNTFIHAPSSGKVVSYASLDNPYWKKRLIRAGRLF